MKFGEFDIGIYVKIATKADLKHLKPFPSDVEVEQKLDVPYLDDGDDRHCLDVFLTKEKEKKNVCLVDIHGGSYVFGSRKNNHYFGSKFIQQGFDFVCCDYVPNQKGRGTDFILRDVAASLKYLAAHKKELGLENDVFALIGDSAGGHVAFMMQAASEDKEMAEKTGLDVGDFTSIALALNCPVYDFALATDSQYLRNSGKKRMFGPKCLDPDYLSLFSPRTYLSSVRVPIFASTCTNDFINVQTFTLKEDIEKQGRGNFEYLFIDETDKSVSHVHNLTNPDGEASKRVNNAMMDFFCRAKGALK